MRTEAEYNKLKGEFIKVKKERDRLLTEIKEVYMSGRKAVMTVTRSSREIEAKTLSDYREAFDKSINHVISKI